MLSRLILALPAFAVAVIGIALVLVARLINPIAAIGAILILLATGWFAGQRGEAMLPRNPKGAVLAFTIWSLCPAMAAATAVALIIYLDVRLDTKSVNDAVTGEMMKTFLTALTGLVTAMFIKMMDDADEQVVGGRVRAAFQAKFKDSSSIPFPEGAYPIVLDKSKLQPWVFDETVGTTFGWGFTARRKRAREIATDMALPAEKALVAAFHDMQALAKANPPGRDIQ